MVDGLSWISSYKWFKESSHPWAGNFLTPVRWGKNEWPVVNGDGTVSPDMDVPTLPQHPSSTLPAKDDFESSKLGMEWNYLNNPIPSDYSLSDQKGSTLKGNDSTLGQLPNVTFVGRRQQHFNFIATTSVDFTPQKINEEAGMTVFMNEEYHYDLALKKSETEVSCS